MLTGPWAGPASRADLDADGALRARYEAYCRGQARALLGLVPRDAIRPLYRRAVAAGFAGDDPSDPMTALVSYCATLLPLPSFDVWRDDALRHPLAYLDDVHESAEAPGPDAPFTFETRDFAYGERTWTAHLRSFRDEDTWRGFIAFQDRVSASVHRTALIFQESSPADVRDRFLGFEPSTLTAFLRSALP